MTLSPDRRQALSGALVALAGPADPAERARLLAATAYAAFETGAEAVVLAELPEGTAPSEPSELTLAVEVVAGSDEGCCRLADLERTAGDGPALACARSGTLVELDLTGDGDDPALPGGVGRSVWGAAAARLGWGLASAVPMTAGGPAVGGLVLLSLPGRRPSASELGWARTLGAVAAAGLLQHRALVRARAMTGQLQEALESRIVIEQAKGVLAERGGIDPSVAFGRMRRYARARRRRLHDVAADVVRGSARDDVLACTGDHGDA